jgi:hypothetical protein
MFEQSPESGSFEFRSGFVVDGHVRNLVVFHERIDIRWELSQILPYRSPNRHLPADSRRKYRLGR